jgi:hypothetical protein
MGKAVSHRALVSSIVLLSLVALGRPYAAFANDKRKFDVRDSIEMSYFGTLSTSRSGRRFVYLSPWRSSPAKR